MLFCGGARHTGFSKSLVAFGARALQTLRPLTHGSLLHKNNQMSHVPADMRLQTPSVDAWPPVRGKVQNGCLLPTGVDWYTEEGMTTFTSPEHVQLADEAGSTPDPAKRRRG